MKTNAQTSDFTSLQMHQRERCASWHKLTYVIGKCRVAPIRHMTIPKLDLQAAVYGVRLRKQTLNEHDVKIEKNPSLDQLINGPTVATDSAQETTSVRCEQSSGNTGKLIYGSMETRQMFRKPC